MTNRTAECESIVSSGNRKSSYTGAEFSACESSIASKQSQGLAGRGLADPSRYMERTSGANIRGTSFVGRFVLEYHPVPGGGAGGTGGRR